MGVFFGGGLSLDGEVICSGSRRFGGGVCAMTRVRGVTKVLVLYCTIPSHTQCLLGMVPPLAVDDAH